MIEFADATKFINDFEAIYSKKIVRIPYTTKEGVRKTILMCKCGNTYISLPFMFLGVIESKTTDRKSAPFMLFETEESNIISTSKKHWEIRDTLAHSPYIEANKLFTWINIADKKDILTLYSSNVRRKINKAHKNEIVVKHGQSKPLIRDFYHVLLQRSKQKGFQPIAKRFVVNSVKRKVSTVFVAYKDGKPIGSATLDDMNNGICVNNLFFTVSQYQKYYVSYALHYAMMTFAKENGTVYYSFGQTGINDGTHLYNKQYKGEDIPLYYSFSKKRKKNMLTAIRCYLQNKIPFLAPQKY